MDMSQIGLLLAIILVYFLVKSKIGVIVNLYGKDKDISKVRINYVKSVLIISWTIVMLSLIGVITGFGIGDFGIFFTSIFAVLGVAFFAQWSILSNVTASVIVFFFFPYRVGDKVKIHDGDNSIEGIIEEITLFHVILNNNRGRIATYPNSMVFQKAVSITRPNKFEVDIEENDHE